MTDKELYLEAGALIDDEYATLNIRIVDMEKHMKFEEFLKWKEYHKLENRDTNSNSIYVSFHENENMTFDNAVACFRRDADKEWREVVPDQWMMSSSTHEDLLREFVEWKNK